MYEQNFIDGCLYGVTDIEELDEYVKYWHTHETGNTPREFLGMLQPEYEEWLKLGDIIIRDILRCRADNITLHEYARMSPEERIAAGSYSIEHIEQLRNDDKNGDQ